MNSNSMRNAAGLVAFLSLAAGLTGCRINVDKDANGQEKNVRIETPFGGIHVNTDQTTAADLGLPVYPGAQAVRNNDKDKSADVHMGFGEWQLRVKVVNYSTPDSKDKVTAFYKKALGRYGDVITCQDGSPIGTPTQTTEGLNCNDDGHPNVNINTGEHNYGYHGKNGFQLKAGSKRHQHIVGFENSGPNDTRFALVALDLPAGTDEDAGKKD